MISLVFAVGSKKQFGHNGTMPWPWIREDMEKFKDVTMNKTVVMGRATFESLPKRLHSRFHVVVSSDPNVTTRNGEKPDVIFDDLDLLDKMMEESINADFCVIGGPKMLYRYVDLATEVHLTVVNCASMPAPEHCDVVLDGKLINHIASEFDIVSHDKLVTRENLNVVYTHFKR